MSEPVTNIIPPKSTIAVLTIDDARQAEPLARVLARSGISTVEVMLRTPCAAEAAAAMIAAAPELTVGLGTVTCPEDLDIARSLGAKFAVSPLLLDTLCDAARELDVPYIPAVQTAAELMRGHELGFELLKFFPASDDSGGPDRLRQFGALLPNMSFCPTGGITDRNVGDYLELANVHCVGASWLAPTEMIDGEEWAEIARRAQLLHEIASLCSQ